MEGVAATKIQSAFRGHMARTSLRNANTPVYLSTRRCVFTRWVNHMLRSVGDTAMGDVVNDLIETNALGELLLTLSGHSVPGLVKRRPDVPLAPHALRANAAACLCYMEEDMQVSCPVTPDDLASKKETAVLAVLWELIYKFQIHKGPLPTEARILGWVKHRVNSARATDFWSNWSNGRPATVRVTDFGPSWADGRALCALINSLVPGAAVEPPEATPLDRAEVAIGVAEEMLKLPPLLLPEELCTAPDPLCVLLYVSLLRDIEQKHSLSRTREAKSFSAGSMPLLIPAASGPRRLVKFRCYCGTKWGEEVSVVGELTGLLPQTQLKCMWPANNLFEWSVELPVNTNNPFQYRYALRTADGNVVWSTKYVLDSSTRETNDYFRIFERAAARGGEAIAFFQKPQRTWRSPALPDSADRALFEQQMQAHGFEPHQLVAHANYLLNLASDPSTLSDADSVASRTRVCLADELRRSAVLGVPCIAVHPGSDTAELGDSRACAAAAECVAWALREAGGTARVALENMAGQGRVLGSSVTQLVEVVKLVPADVRPRVGVCLDTAHLWGAGYDTRDEEVYDAVVRAADESVRAAGGAGLLAVHANDSMAQRASHQDRHANLGCGTMGLVPLWRVVNDARTLGIPIVLETPAGAPVDELALIRALEGAPAPAEQPRDSGSDEAPDTQQSSARSRSRSRSKKLAAPPGFYIPGQTDTPSTSSAGPSPRSPPPSLPPSPDDPLSASGSVSPLLPSPRSPRSPHGQTPAAIPLAMPTSAGATTPPRASSATQLQGAQPQSSSSSSSSSASKRLLSMLLSSTPMPLKHGRHGSSSLALQVPLTPPKDNPGGTSSSAASGVAALAPPLSARSWIRQRRSATVAAGANPSSLEDPAAVAAAAVAAVDRSPDGGKQFIVDDVQPQHSSTSGHHTKHAAKSSWIPVSANPAMRLPTSQEPRFYSPGTPSKRPSRPRSSTSAIGEAPPMYYTSGDRSPPGAAASAEDPESPRPMPLALVARGAVSPQGTQQMASSPSARPVTAPARSRSAILMASSPVLPTVQVSHVPGGLVLPSTRRMSMQPVTTLVGLAAMADGEGPDYYEPEEREAAPVIPRRARALSAGKDTKEFALKASGYDSRTRFSDSPSAVRAERHRSLMLPSSSSAMIDVHVLPPREFLQNKHISRVIEQEISDVPIPVSVSAPDAATMGDSSPAESPSMQERNILMRSAPPDEMSVQRTLESAAPPLPPPPKSQEPPTKTAIDMIAPALAKAAAAAAEQPIQLKRRSNKGRDSMKALELPLAAAAAAPGEDMGRRLSSPKVPGTPGSVRRDEQDVKALTVTDVRKYIANVFDEGDAQLYEIVHTSSGTIERPLDDNEVVPTSAAGPSPVSPTGTPERREVVVRRKGVQIGKRRMPHPEGTGTDSESLPPSPEMPVRDGKPPQIKKLGGDDAEQDALRQKKRKQKAEGKKKQGSPSPAKLFTDTQPYRVQEKERRHSNLALVKVGCLVQGKYSSCWTLAISPACTAHDVCNTVIEEDIGAGSSTVMEAKLVEFHCADDADAERIFHDNVEEQMKQFQGEEAILDRVTSWGPNPEYRLYVIASHAPGYNFEKTTDSSGGAAIVVDRQLSDSAESYWIKEEEIKWLSKISSGSFAKVFKAIYDGKVVAVKILKGRLDNKVIAEFKKEFQVLKAAKHPNLVEFYGVSTSKDRLSYVMEYCQRGTLLHVMADPNIEIDWSKALSFLEQATKGLQFLHQLDPQIVHRDLKSQNLLVTKTWEVKLADFGLSRFNTISNGATLGNLCGTMSHCAPEIFTGEKYTTKSDIYSLGMILWEVAYRTICGQYSVPFSEYPWICFDFQIIVQTSSKNLRPTIPPECPEPVTQLINSCWNKDPSVRPSAGEVLQTLASFKDLLAPTQ
eukprot:m51a1_g11818 putative ankyrin repeat-containing protein (1896) ;mRNA; f:398836-406865